MTLNSMLRDFVSSTQAKLVSVVESNGELVYHFKLGEVKYVVRIPL